MTHIPHGGTSQRWIFGLILLVILLIALAGVLSGQDTRKHKNSCAEQAAATLAWMESDEGFKFWHPDLDKSKAYPVPRDGLGSCKSDDVEYWGVNSRGPRLCIPKKKKATK